MFTSRTLPFTSSIWPSADVSDLRSTTPALLAGLSSPFLMSSYATSNLKIPYTSQGAAYGILIENIHNLPSVAPTNGIDIGGIYQGAAALNSNADFNLFDNLGTGIDITDASLTTMNNVFQNMQYNSSAVGMSGSGIEHRILNTTGAGPSGMNAQLDLRPIGPPSNQSTAYGNRFWNCYTGIHTSDVYHINVEYGLFRSAQSIVNITPLDYQGMLLETNRFDYNIRFSEFNNLRYGITMNNNSGLYDVNGSGLASGIYANNIVVNQNYFGAHVSSSTPLNNNEYFGDAVHLNGPNSPVYQLGSIAANASIMSNKIDRAFRGISINSMFDYPVNVLGNNIFVVDELPSLLSKQYGIQAFDNSGNLVINDNSLSSNNILNNFMSLVYCKNNTGINTVIGGGSPMVKCNNTNNSYEGFEFEGNNSNANWHGNTMKTHERAYVLRANGIIGTQGSSSQASGNLWLGGFTWDTWCDNSDADLSPLWVRTFVATENPTINGSTGIANPYVTGISTNIFKTRITYSCPGTSYPTLPSQRMTNSTNLNETNQLDINTNWTAEVSPNPTNGNIHIVSSIENETMDVQIRDVTGKIIFSKKIVNNESNTLDISSLNTGLYFIQIKNQDNKIIRKKIVKE